MKKGRLAHKENVEVVVHLTDEGVEGNLKVSHTIIFHYILSSHKKCLSLRKISQRKNSQYEEPV